VCRLAVVLFWLGGVACSRELVNVAEVNGRWMVDAEVRQRLQLSTARAELIIDRDGTFRASEIPADLLFVDPAPLRTTN
jgi:hypothetical protein